MINDRSQMMPKKEKHDSMMGEQYGPLKDHPSFAPVKPRNKTPLGDHSAGHGRVSKLAYFDNKTESPVRLISNIRN